METLVRPIIGTPDPGEKNRFFGPKCNTPTLLHLGPNATPLTCCIAIQMQHPLAVAKAVEHPTDATPPQGCCIWRQMQHPWYAPDGGFEISSHFLMCFPTFWDGQIRVLHLDPNATATCCIAHEAHGCLSGASGTAA